MIPEVTKMKQEGYLFALFYQLDTGGKGKGFSVYTMNACRVGWSSCSSTD
jgi:hypothetical protein